MRVRFFLVLLMFAFAIGVSVFSATTINSGSGSLPKPMMEFKSWQVGRGSVGSNIDSTVHTSSSLLTRKNVVLRHLLGIRVATNHRVASPRLILLQ